MMNTIEPPQRLPATEALETCISMQMIPEREIRKAKIVTPQSSDDSLESAPRKKKRSFDMADLISATEPVEQAIAFPTIEWCRDDESEHEVEPDSEHKALHLISPFNDLNDEQDDYFPTCFSSTGLGKRSRLGYSRIGRSRSLKTSLCSLAEQDTSTFQEECSKLGGSWPKFARRHGEPEPMRQHKRQKSLKAAREELRPNVLVPLVA